MKVGNVTKRKWGGGHIVLYTQVTLDVAIMLQHMLKSFDTRP